MTYRNKSDNNHHQACWEMRTLRCTTLRDEFRNEEIRNICEIQTVTRWSRIRRRAWREHVNKTITAKMAKNGKPNVTKLPGWSPKRWCESWTLQENRHTEYRTWSHKKMTKKKKNKKINPSEQHSGGTWRGSVSTTLKAYLPINASVAHPQRGV